MSDVYLGIWMEPHMTAYMEETETASRTKSGFRSAKKIAFGDLAICVHGMDDEQLDKFARSVAKMAGLNVIN